MTGLTTQLISSVLLMGGCHEHQQASYMEEFMYRERYALQLFEAGTLRINILSLSHQRRQFPLPALKPCSSYI